MWRLRKCLRGEAKEAASALLMGNTSPQDVMDTLELRFGRPEIVMRQESIQLRWLSPLPEAYHSEIVKFAIMVKNYVTAVTTLKQSDYLSSPQLSSIVVSKMPTNLINKWVEYLHERLNQETPKLQLLSEFLYVEAKKVAESRVSYIHHQNEYSRKYEKTDKKSVLTAMVVDTAQAKCRFCKRTAEHSFSDCGKFKRAMRNDRWRFVRANKLCFKCLGARH